MLLSQDPPYFTVLPGWEYRQEAGRELLIPCAAAGDPFPVIAWRKVPAAPGAPGWAGVHGKGLGKGAGGGARGEEPGSGVRERAWQGCGEGLLLLSFS